MNKYRVDRVAKDSTICPCGMNSILHIGDNLSKARQYFLVSRSGFDTWNKPDASYGVALSQWNDVKRDYVRIGFKDSYGSIFMTV